MGRRDELEERARVALDELQAARGGASIETARSLLGPASRRGLPTEQRSAANARTREYKARQALARAPRARMSSLPAAMSFWISLSTPPGKLTVPCVFGC